MEGPGAQRIAAAARALGPELSELVAIHADAIAGALARQLELVAWDREQLVGLLQTQLYALRTERFRELGGSPVRVVERRRQPLESIELVWRYLRQGRRVRLEHEPGACTSALELLRGMSHALGSSVLTVADVPWADASPRPASGSTSRMARASLDVTDDPQSWPVVGVYDPGPRIALVEAPADRELAAYVLARTALRRTGTDPRAVKRAYVIGAVDRLQRHLQRLWVGANMGPSSDPESFAGPVDEDVRDAFMQALEKWEAHEGVSVWAPGGVLERAGDSGIYLAPTLFATDWPAPDLPLEGPMLAIVRCTVEQARAAAENAARQAGHAIQVGGRPRSYPGDVRVIRGALLVERLPPGLPEPRPV
jgi:hypothetical protein